MKDKLIAILAVLGILLISGCVEEETGKEQACIDSGGTVTTGMCCKSTGDFPDLCAVGACACSPENSHEVKICDCGEGKCFDGNACVRMVNNFDDCVKAGYPVMESYPRQCKTPDGRIFTEEICNGMSLFEAKEIAIASECGDRLKDTCMCNADTGTWWLDLDIEKEGCNPACVVNVVTKTATINWRCTGVILEPEGFFEAGPCNDSISPYNQSELGIKETNWLDNETLQIKAYVSINCAEEIVGGDFEINDDKIILMYASPRCGDDFACARCMCAHELVYRLSDLEKKEYSFELKRI